MGGGLIAGINFQQSGEPVHAIAMFKAPIHHARIKRHPVLFGRWARPAIVLGERGEVDEVTRRQSLKIFAARIIRARAA